MKKTIKKLLISLITITVIVSGNVAKATTMDIRIGTIQTGIVQYWHNDREDSRYLAIRSEGGNIIYEIKEGTIKTVDASPTFVSKQKITNPNIINIVRNGYPSKTKEELKVSDDIFACTATQEAIYMVLDNKAKEGYETLGIGGQEIVKSAKKIVEAVENNNMHKNQEFQIQPIQEQWQEQAEQYYKEYKIKTTRPIASTRILLQGSDAVTVTDSLGNPKTTFQNEEVLRICVPKNKSNQSFSIRLSATITGYIPYLLIDNSQNEYIYIEEGNYEVETLQAITIKDMLEEVHITNKDKTTQDPIQGNKFALKDEKGNIILQELVTNEQGEILIQNLPKGKYQLQQMQAAEGYTKLKSSVPIVVTGMEKSLKIEIENTKIREEQREEIENTSKETHVTENNTTIVQTNSKDITNQHTNNTYQEIINQIKEKDVYQNNYFVNTINQKTKQKETRDEYYQNKIDKPDIILEDIYTSQTHELQMTRQDYINKIDCIQLGKNTPLKLPRTGK